MWSNSTNHHISQREPFLVDDVCILASSTGNWIRLDLFPSWMRNLHNCLAISAAVMFFSSSPSSSYFAKRSPFLVEVSFYVLTHASNLHSHWQKKHDNFSKVCLITCHLLYKEHSINHYCRIAGHLFSWGDMFCETGQNSFACFLQQAFWRCQYPWQGAQRMRKHLCHVKITILRHYD